MFTRPLPYLLIVLALSCWLQSSAPLLYAETTSVVPGYALPVDLERSGQPVVVPSANSPGSLTVLILGDSLSLCGFGKSLDQRFRSDARVQSTFTYMACGTVPASWLKKKPFNNAKTYCGFWSIESVTGKAKPREFEDTYGMKWRGYKPKPYPVPKLEELLSLLHPQILIMQTGNNLLSLFRDGKSVLPSRHGPLLESLIAPFFSEALNPASTLRKIYWVASPVSGRVSKGVQDFVVNEVRSISAGKATVIDSRPLVSYPYRHMAPDREHFFGAQMDQWAEKVFKIIAQDLTSKPFSGSPPVTEPSEVIKGPVPNSVEEADKTLSIIGALKFKSQPLQVDQLLPYQESLVAYVYEVREVLKGDYKEKEILVMHPAHIGLQVQPLDQFEVGKIYELHLRELDGTSWSTIKSQDQSDRIDLTPYIRVEDEIRFPAQNR